MSKLKDAILCTNLPARDVKNSNILSAWALAWAASLGIIAFISRYEWYSAPLPITAAIVVNVGIGLGMILAYKHFLKELDELERKVQLDALALSVGVTLVVFGGYSILDKAGVAPALEASHLIMLIALTYIAGIIVGRIRYQ
jgi:hypothetical protein